MKLKNTIATVASAALAAVTLAACDHEESTDPEAFPTISLPAITISAGGESDGSEYCTLMVEVFDEQVALATRMINEALPALVDALGSADTSGINSIGADMNEVSVAQRDRLYDAAEYIPESETAARDGMSAMINYIDSYLLPFGLIYFGAQDPFELSEDVGDLHALPSVTGAISDQETLAPALASYTEARCGIDLPDLEDLAG